MRYEFELAVSRFVVAFEIAAHGLVPDQIDSSLCEDGTTVSTYVYCGEKFFIAPPVTLSRASAEAFDRREFERGFLKALMVRLERLN